MRVFAVLNSRKSTRYWETRFSVCCLTFFTVFFCNSIGVEGQNGNSIQTQIDPSEYCRSVGGRLGKCVPLQQCTIFSEWLRQRPVIKSRIRTIVQFTCYFDVVVPKVCCPLRYIVTDEEVDLQKEITANLIQDKGGFGNTNPSPSSIKYPQTEQSYKQSSPNRSPIQRTSSGSAAQPLLFPSESTSDIETDSRSKKVLKAIGSENRLKKFQRLIPELEDCGSSVALGRLLGAYGSHPWIALIGVKDENAHAFTRYCSGTVISKRYILTSASCLFRKNPTNIRLGDYNLETTFDYGSQYLPATTFKDYQIEKLIPHPRFDRYKMTDNIALIRVDTDIDFSTPNSFIKPVCLPFITEYGLTNVNLDGTGVKTLIAGWGKISSNSTGHTILQEAPAQITSHEECTQDGKYPSPKEFYCVGGNRRQNICISDLGGPLLTPVRTPSGSGSRKLPTPKVFQLGIFSSGPNSQQCRTGRSIISNGDASSNKADSNASSDNHRLVFFRSGVSAIPPPSLFIKVSNYLDWILDTVE